MRLTKSCGMTADNELGQGLGSEWREEGEKRKSKGWELGGEENRWYKNDKTHISGLDGGCYRTRTYDPLLVRQML